MNKSLIYFSSGIKKLKFLGIFLSRNLVNKSNSLKNVEAVICWGYRPTSSKARAYAKTQQLPCWQLEDGFLRSYHTGDLSPLLALIVDQTGVYYESRRASDLETIINDASLDSRDVMTQVKLSRDAILKFQLSKYNHAPDLNDGVLRSDDLARVLVVDQTDGDMSVVCGGASEASFADMLHAALLENPTATIYVKTHPEVSAGRKGGYLTEIQNSERVVVVRDTVNPIDLIQKIDKVYVVTSTMGFEALLCGKPVVCFGVPWYAGWGVTDDRVQDSPAWARRTKKRTVDELFAAAYLHYTRYLNPFTHERGTIFDVIGWLVLQKKMARAPFSRSAQVANVVK
jgi:capsular polysaccharide export protein